MVRKTRKQHGGGLQSANRNRIRTTFVGKTDEDKKQIKHAICQLFRFIRLFKLGDMSRRYQFGYNLGRLQELCFETTHPEIWWKPIEGFLDGAENAKTEEDRLHNWKGLEAYTHELREALNIEVTDEMITRGCK